ncbi:hypothetical protein HD806DRAFT_516413 [Xylariaceae sp. AK1471]|nr:hypothetical protein HD806DRAFT_516413 [Xylariaceae sp. AK1471]
MTMSRSNLGPFTTAFTYPASCAVAVQSCATCDVFWQGQTCSDNTFNAQGVQDNTQCWPSRKNSHISTGVALGGWGFYSPGVSCPVGYATSCVATGTVDGGFPFQFSILESETAVGCCPTGFHCKYAPGVDGAQTCYSIATAGSFAAVQCSSGTSNGFSYYNVPATVTETGGDSVTLLSAVTVYAPLFQLLHQSTDLPPTQTSSTPQPSSTTQAATSTSTSTIPEPSTSPSTQGSLSSGAKAGIGVGASIGGLALIGAALFFFFRRRRGRTPVSEMPVTEPEPKQFFPQQHVQLAELPYDYSPRSELPS